MIFTEDEKKQLADRIAQKELAKEFEKQELMSAQSKIKTGLVNAYAALEQVAKGAPDLFDSVGLKPRCIYKGKGLFPKRICVYELHASFGSPYNFHHLYVDLEGNIMTATWNKEKPSLYSPKSNLIKQFDEDISFSRPINKYSKEADTAKIYVPAEYITGFLLSVCYDIYPDWDVHLSERFYTFCVSNEVSESRKVELVKEAFKSYAERSLRSEHVGINDYFRTKM